MKCPEKHKKETELMTKRTHANGKEVRRERYCPTCKKRFWTVERFEDDIEAEKEKNKNLILELGQKLRIEQDKLYNFGLTLKDFRKMLDTVK